MPGTARGVAVKVEEKERVMAAPNLEVKIEDASEMDGGVAIGGGV